ncbi:MAG: hypothetical protein WAM60_07655 [Candidatus Promineifilaceae bacterium]
MLKNTRFSYEELSEGLYAITKSNVDSACPEYLIIAIDPVNFEKPYTKKLEGVSTVHKSTLPDLNGQVTCIKSPGYTVPEKGSRFRG